MVKITGFTAHQTMEGKRITYTWSVIDEDGRVTKSNQRDTIIVVDEEINAAITSIENWLRHRVAES